MNCEQMYGLILVQNISVLGKNMMMFTVSALLASLDVSVVFK